MRQFWFVVAAAIAVAGSAGLAQQNGPYKILRTAKVDGGYGFSTIWFFIGASAPSS